MRAFILMKYVESTLFASFISDFVYSVKYEYLLLYQKAQMKKRILILDDKESIAKIVSFYLSSEFEIVWLENPIKGIAWLLSGNIPDLIISDIKMPEMRGDEFLRYIKSNEIFKTIPVIMLSSEDSTSERIRLLSEGADDYIVKPFNPMELKIRIKKII